MITNSKAMEMAKKALEGKKLKAAGITIVGFILYIVASIIFSNESYTTTESVSIAQTISSNLKEFVYLTVTDFFAIGFLVFFYNLYKNINEAFKDLVCGFKNFKRNAIILVALNIPYIIVLFLIFTATMHMSALVTPEGQNIGIVLAFVLLLGLLICFLAYKLFPTLYLLALRMGIDNSTGALKLILDSYSKASKYNYQFFCLQFKFIGWIILGCITLGIAFLWAAPYFWTTTAILADAIINPDEYKNDILGEVPTTETVPAEPKRIEEEHHFSPEE